MTNFEKIKAMSVEEMAEYLCDNSDCDVCPAYWPQYCESSNLHENKISMEKYLKSEVEE